ncbi:hypothetical protein AAFF_G00174670 [Aldrovandia affinis]|uniref:Ig-like domain-containing protein n=1 Tax=Aldrovandia affinis TaxID=143900 RepID=A0AAD7RNV3_9TELE|nr:hypothetical protein AAFF_G00174670 [Aldrovandia affinis]
MKIALVFIALWTIPVQVPAAGNTGMTADVKHQTKIECKHGFPTVDIITWKKDNDQIAYKSSEESKINPQYELEEGHGTAYLVIREVNEKDAGNYTCAVFVTKGVRRYRTIEVKLEVKDTANMVKLSLTAILFAFLLHAIFL